MTLKEEQEELEEQELGSRGEEEAAVVPRREGGTLTLSVQVGIILEYLGFYDYMC